MKKIFQKPYVYFLVIISLVYLSLNVILSKFYVTIRYIPYYLGNLNWLELIVSIIFTIIITILLSINIINVYLKYKNSLNINKQAGISCGFTVAGLSTGVCPSCISGFFPFILSAFGITFTWAFLPFKGLEIQLLTIVLLSASLYFFNIK